MALGTGLAFSAKVVSKFIIIVMATGAFYNLLMLYMRKNHAGPFMNSEFTAIDLNYSFLGKGHWR